MPFSFRNIKPDLFMNRVELSVYPKHSTFASEGYISINSVSYDTCVYHFWFVFSPWGIPQLQSDLSLSCDHGLDYAS